MYRQCFALILLFRVLVLCADERPYFEELDKFKIPEATVADLKVTLDGRYMLASITSGDVQQSVIYVYQLQTDEQGIRRIRDDPVSTMHFDGLNKPLYSVINMQLAGNNIESTVKVYVYSRAFDADMPALISGYQLDDSGLLEAIPFAYLELGPFPRGFRISVPKAIHLQDDLLYAITENSVEIIKVHHNGTLTIKDQSPILPVANKTHEGPLTLSYLPETKKLFVGLGNLDNSEQLEHNIVALAFSITANDSFNKTAPVQELYFKNGVYSAMTVLSESSESEEKIVMGLNGLISNKEGDDVFSLMVVSPISMAFSEINLKVPVLDVEFTRSNDQVYISSIVLSDTWGIGLSAYKIQDDLSPHVLSGSELNTTMSHHDIELTPDNCHLLAVAGGGFEQRQSSSYIILYRINDPALNCTAPPSSIPLKLLISVPSAVMGVVGVSLLVFLGCYLAKQYGARKGYVPIDG